MSSGVTYPPPHEGYLVYYLTLYRYRDGDWRGSTGPADGHETEDPNDSPYGCCGVDLGITSCWPWDGNLEGIPFRYASEQVAAYIAKLLTMPAYDYLLDYLRQEFPEGGGDPNFPEAVRQFAEASGPETVARDSAFRNPAGTTEQGDPVF